MDFHLPNSICRRASIVPALACAVLVGCSGQVAPPGPGFHYTRNEVELYSGLEHDAPVVSVLEFDTPVTVLDTHRSFARVRAAGQLEGWLPSSMLLDEALRRQLSRLTNLAAAVPAQGEFRSRDTLNVHTEPYRWAPTFYQLDKEEGFQMLDRMVVDRLPAAAADPSYPVKPTGEDYWYLARIPDIGEAGWLLANMAYADVPLDLGALAQGRPIVAYFQIGSVQDESLGESKPTWVWFQSSGRGQTHDFDRLRVFQWDSRRDRYVVIRQASELAGYLPVEILPEFRTDRGVGTGFRVLVEKDGRIHERTYAYIGRRVSYLGEKAVTGIPRVSAPGGFGKRYGRRGIAAF